MRRHKKTPSADTDGMSKKGTSPSTLGQGNQSSSHYKNHNYNTTKRKRLQGGWTV